MPSFRTTRRVPFTPRQMFDLVADVERYPEFLPFCEALLVKRRDRHGDKDSLVADMSVGYMAIRETFTTRVTFDPGQLAVHAQGTEESRGPFRQLENRWQFRTVPGGCDVDFFIAYEFKSMMLQMLVGALFDRAFRRYTAAFEERARAIYGAETPAAREIS
jgi:coenzyme Q-binding protein COQ10